MQSGRYITYDPTILIQRNDHTLLETRGWYITDNPTIRLHFVKKRKKKEKKNQKKMNLMDYVSIIVYWN